MKLKYLIIPKIRTFSKESTRKQESLRWLNRPGCYGKQEENLMRRKKFTVKGTVKWPNKIAVKRVSQRSCLGSIGNMSSTEWNGCLGEDRRNSASVISILENFGYEEQMETGGDEVEAGEYMEQVLPLTLCHILIIILVLTILCLVSLYPSGVCVYMCACIYVGVHV